MIKVAENNPGKAFKAILSLSGTKQTYLTQLIKNTGKIANYKQINRQISLFCSISKSFVFSQFEDYCRELGVEFSYVLKYNKTKKIIGDNLGIIIDKYLEIKKIKYSDVAKLLEITSFSNKKMNLYSSRIKSKTLYKICEKLNIQIDYCLKVPKQIRREA